MLGKLLKHEFRATSRTMLPIFAVVLILSLVANFSFRNIVFEDIGIAGILASLFIAAFFISIVVMGIMSVVVMIDRFYKNLLGNEGYLSFTLPVSVHGLVWAKLIVSFVWFVVTAIIAFAAMAMAVSTLISMNFEEIFRNLPSLREAFEMFYESTGISQSQLLAFILQMIAMVILSSLCVCLHFYAAMALGHSFSNNKVLLSVVFFIAISFLFQLISAAIGVSTGGVITITTPAGNSGSQVMQTVQGLSLYSLLMQLAQGVILYVTTTLCLKKRLNLG